MPAVLWASRQRSRSSVPSAKASTRCPSSSPATGADIVPVYVSRTPSAQSHFSQQALVPRGFADGN
jgi:hypothetical protein